MEVEVKKKPIMGKVSGVLTERKLAINIGSKHGVTPRMKFRVLAEKLIEIHDPETNEVLGTVDQEKVRVEACEVHESFTVCRTYKTTTIGFVAIIGKEIPETLKADASAILPPLSEKEAYVKKGDRVSQVFDDD